MSATGQPDQAPRSSRRSPAPRLSSKARLEGRLADVLRAHQIPGATAAMLTPRTSIQAASGFGDLAAGVRMRADSVMPCGSIGKSFVAALALGLAQQGRVDLDAPARTWLGQQAWLPRLANGGEATLRTLLNHTAGIADHRITDCFANALRGLLTGPGADPDGVLDPEQLVSFVLDAPASFAPGEGFAYSETGYILAGLILRQATGHDPLAMVEERLLKPLRLKRTHPMSSRLTPGLVDGVIGDHAAGLPAHAVSDSALAFHPATEFTGGGFYASSGDLAHWARALFEGDALDGPYLDDLLRATPTGDPYDVGYGLGVRLMATPHGLAYGHYGEFPGYMSLMAYYPARRIAVAAQINSWPHDRSLLRQLQESLFETAAAAC